MKKVAPKVDKTCGYLPKDLQRVGQHMDRVAFLRQPLNPHADRQYKHSMGPGSGLSEHGAVDLGDKVAMVAGALKRLKGVPKIVPKPPPPAPLGSWRRPDDPVFMGGYTVGGSSGSGG